MKKIKVTIKGTSPLLTQRFSETSEQVKPSRRMEVVRNTPREQAEAVAYRDIEGRFYFPAAAIARLLRDSAGNHKLRGSRRSARYVIPGVVLLLEENMLLTNGDGKTLVKDFEVDSRSVVIPSTKGRVMKHRPSFDCWSLAFTLRINDEILTWDFIHQLLREGGEMIGLGDFRPQKGGPFGCFAVTEWKELTQ